MITTIQTIIWGMALLILLPSTILLIECCAALFTQHYKITSERPKTIVVLVPAHNEANNITQTLDSITPQLADNDQLWVIADNCSDNTAAIARQSGAIVIERENAAERGKGYALNYAIRLLESEPPEMVVSIDADSWVEANTIDAIARLAKQRQRPVQAPYTMKPPENPSAKDMISALAILVKNVVRPMGLSQLGLPSLLTGSGMAFPWHIIQQAPLANSKTADDMQLSIDLAISGYAPRYCSLGGVSGRLMEKSAATSQRSRWEHGHIENLLVETPRLIQAAFLRQQWTAIGLALELIVPPLSLLILLWGGTTSLAIAATYFLQLTWIPISLLGLAGFFILIAITTSWIKFAREIIPLKTLLTIPIYLLWKIPLYFNFLIKPQSRWLKTERDDNTFT